ncbi:hypothetical protein OEZ85_013796 [Tetradesmus obliquus]|uniref:Vacuolar import/degradation Vid27 C-terminal domain-containing protein n=1 Tax=Tetradesmus obliquus TaxID=3088 RepID=A0ABY8U6M6_TETOB|nr:hypothetical protein OEZ85_013796 [Tetradesmus obliquus]
MFVGDLETIVRTLDFTKDDVEVSQARICTSSKAAQLSDSPYLLGLDRNRLSMWDFRTQAGIVEWIDGREYGRGYNFKCLATSGDGHVVVGSADGKISLYKAGKLTKAQKVIPGIGKPITAIDITYDSSWILATTDDYLLVIGAVTEGGRRSAFRGACAPGPVNMRMLRLTPDDEAAAGLAGYAFTNAKFPWVTDSNSESDCERWITASRGSYTVMWNFARVKTSAGATFDDGDYPTFEEYHLSTQGQHPVVDSAFMHHRSADLQGGAPDQDLPGSATVKQAPSS